MYKSTAVEEQRIEEMLDEDSEYRTILNTLLKIFECEFSRFERLALRHEKLKSRAIKHGDLVPKLEKDTKSINIVIAKQNQIFHMCLEILNRSNFLVDKFNLMEQYEAAVHEITVIFQRFACYLVKTLDRNDPALILTAFEMMDKIFDYFGIPDFIKKEHLALRMERFFENKVYLYPHYLLGKLFRYNFLDREELKIIIPSIVSSTDDKRIRQNTFQLLSLMSFNQTVKESLIENEFDIGLFGIMINLVRKKHSKGVKNFSKSQIQRALINTVLNLSSEPKEAQAMINNPLFKFVLKIGFETLDVGLLKIINNVTYFCPPDDTKKMKKNVLILREILKKLYYEEEGQNMLAISELIGILGNCCLEEDWLGFLDKEFLKMLFNLQVHQNDHVRLQVIMLIAQLCAHKKSATILYKKNLITRMLTSVRIDLREESLQVLYVIYQLILCGVDISEILQPVVDIVQDFLDLEFRERNVRVVSFMNEFLTILQVNYNNFEFMGELMEQRFSHYNLEWEKKVGLEDVMVEDNFAYDDLMFYADVPMMMPEEYMAYYDEEGEYADYGDEDVEL